MNIFAHAIDWTEKLGRISAQDLVAAAQTSEWFPYSSLPKSLAGKNIVFTGELPTLLRVQAENMATKAGAHSRGAVSNNTDLVVVGNAPGSKIQKAKKLGLKIINEAEFLFLANNLKLDPNNFLWSSFENNCRGLYVRGDSGAIVRYMIVNTSPMWILRPMQMDALKVPGAQNTEITITK